MPPKLIDPTRSLSPEALQRMYDLCTQGRVPNLTAYINANTAQRLGLTVTQDDEDDPDAPEAD